MHFKVTQHTIVQGSLPEGLNLPNRTSAMASPPDCPGYPTQSNALALAWTR